MASRNIRPSGTAQAQAPLAFTDSLATIARRFAHALVPPAGHFVLLHVDGQAAGRITPERAQRLAEFDHVFHWQEAGLTFAPSLALEPARTAAVAEVTRALASEGALTPWRDELYAVAPAFGAAPWFRLERAAARYFGIRTHAAHVNGLVRDGDRIRMWLARRSATKAIDPGMLDNLVGGGIAAGASVAQTVVKESWEEAGIPADLAAQAIATDTLHVTRELPDGLQDETIFAHDLWLPGDFAPANQDGEAVAHRCLPLAAVAGLLVQDDEPDALTVDASLVALHALLRLGAIDPRSPWHEKLRALGTAPP